jgi:opacity protein-like surface antigen
VHRFRLASLLAAAPLAAAAATAAAQPIEEVAPPPAGAVDEARVRELAAEIAAEMIAEERARIAADAAAAAPPDTVDREDAAPPAPDQDDYLSGSNGFMDVRLNLTFTNENVLVEPGETIPSVPGWRFGRPSSLGTLFFDNYDTRFSGYETLSHAVMYRNYRKDHLEAEAGFVLRINEIAERRIDLSDAGSYVLVSWWQDPRREDPTRLSLTAFPISADRFRLGYSYRLSWGGTEEYRRSTQAVPGVKLQVDTDQAYAFVGAKSSVLLDPATAEQEAVMAFLAGAGFDVTPEIRVEANGGFFDRGGNELEDVKTENVHLFGGSMQVAYHVGMPVQSSIDYKLYKNDPERIGRLFQRARYPGGVSYLAMAEATLIGQTLKDPAAFGSTKIQWGAAGDINVRAMMDRIRVRLDLQYRDLAFILHSVPSLPTFSDFPDIYKITPNFFAAAGADHNWDDRLTLGAVVGVELPATLTTPTGIPGDDFAMGESTAVIRNNGQQTLITILPQGKKALTQVAVKTSAQYDFGEIFAALLDVYYVYDPNQTRLTREGPDDLFKYEFGELHQLGLNATLQAKF